MQTLPLARAVRQRGPRPRLGRGGARRARPARSCAGTSTTRSTRGSPRRRTSSWRGCTRPPGRARSSPATRASPLARSGEDFDAFVAELEAAPLRAARRAPASRAHQMGSCRMGSRPGDLGGRRPRRAARRQGRVDRRRQRVPDGARRQPDGHDHEPRPPHGGRDPAGLTWEPPRSASWNILPIRYDLPIRISSARVERLAAQRTALAHGDSPRTADSTRKTVATASPAAPSRVDLRDDRAGSHAHWGWSGFALGRRARCERGRGSGRPVRQARRGPASWIRFLRATGRRQTDPALERALRSP